jgi:hypothetical protein
MPVHYRSTGGDPQKHIVTYADKLCLEVAEFIDWLVGR